MGSLDRVSCSRCGIEHDLSEIEPTYMRPDAYYDVPADEREFRLWEGKDEFGIRSLDDSERRFFLRVVLPIPVRGENRPCNWGVWVEVAEQAFYRARELWDDPAQGNEAPFAGILANTLRCFEETLGLHGTVQLVSPEAIPEFRLAQDSDHPLACDQREGVLPERVLEWVWDHVHQQDAA